MMRLVIVNPRSQDICPIMPSEVRTYGINQLEGHTESVTTVIHAH